MRKIYNFVSHKTHNMNLPFLRSAGIISLLLFSTEGHARTIISTNTGKPIQYASVGIVNRNLGTVTDSAGNFSLTIPREFVNDSLKISAITYRLKVFAVKDLKNLPDTIGLEEDVIILSEIVVKPQKLEHKTAGRKSSGGFIYINVEGYKAAGQGLAVPLKVSKRAWIKSLGFTILEDKNTLSRMKFRVNVYEKDGDRYSLLASAGQLYFDYNRSDLKEGHFHYDFPEEIMLEKGEYYLELEFLENFTDEVFVMKSRPMTGKTRYRYASQSGWETLPFGATLYFEYDDLK